MFRIRKERGIMDGVMLINNIKLVELLWGGVWGIEGLDSWGDCSGVIG